MARPSTFDQERADAICEKISEGESLRKICRADGMPSVATVLRWVGKHPEFKISYDAARGAYEQHLFDELREIADDGSKDWIDRPDGKGGTTRVVDHEHINRSKLRVDTLKFVLAKLNPARYGDRIEVDGKTHTTVDVRLQEMPDGEQARERAKALCAAAAALGLKLVPADAVILEPRKDASEPERKLLPAQMARLGLAAPVIEHAANPPHLPEPRWRTAAPDDQEF